MPFANRYSAMLALIAAALVHVYLKRRQAKRLKAATAMTKIPGSFGGYLLGETLEFAADMRDFENARFKRHGNVFKTHVAGKNVVFVAGRRLAEFVLTEAPQIEVGTFDTFQALMQDSVVLMKGATHRHARLQITKVLSDAQLDNNLGVLYQVFAPKVAQWRGPIPIYASLKDALFTAACRVLFGMDKEHFEPVVKTLRDLTLEYAQGFFALPIDFGSYSEFGRALLAKDRLMAFVRDLADQRRARPDLYHKDGMRPDFLQILLDSKVDGEVADDLDKVASNVTTILLGATDTTASLAGQALIQLNSDSVARARVRAEFEAVFGSGPLEQTKVTSKTMSQLPFVDAFLRECLRLYPPFANVWRAVVDDVTLPGPEGFVIPKGWMVATAMNWTHQIDSSAFPEPNDFIPNRFLPTGSSSASADFSGALLPFGKGAHACPGKWFALAEAKLLLALIMLRPNKAFPSVFEVPTKWGDRPAWEPLEDMEMVF